MPTEALNTPAYQIDADNLFHAAQYPVLHREIEVPNPKAEVKRGTAVLASGGACKLAGTDGATGNVAAIVVSGAPADDEAETLVLDAYVSGAFNAARVCGVGEFDATAAAVVLGAQANGIYLL